LKALIFYIHTKTTFISYNSFLASFSSYLPGASKLLLPLVAN
jgi:hypothetical protein